MNSDLSIMSIVRPLQLSEEPIATAASEMPLPNVPIHYLSLPIPRQSDIHDCKAKYSSEIERIKAMPEVIGLSFVQDDHDCFFPVYTKMSLQTKEIKRMDFHVHRLSDDVKIGVALVLPEIDSEFRIGWISNYSDLREHKMKRIAVLLHKAIHQYLLSQIGRNYNIYIDTMQGTASYYYRSGFLAEKEETNAYLNECVKTHVRDENACETMTLSREGREFWQREVSTFPISFDLLEEP